MPTETVVVTTNLNAAGVARQGANRVALLAPLDAAATVAANVVKKYRRASDAEVDHSAGSKIAIGVKAALNSGAPFVFAVGVGARTGSPFTETFGASPGPGVSSGTLTAARLPITAVSSATKDGTALTIVYTSKDPTAGGYGATIGSTELHINTKTGKFKLLTATSGTGAGLIITYSSHDWDAALNALDVEAYEYHSPAGSPFNGQNFGIYDKLVTHAGTENKVVAGALADGAAVSAVDSSSFSVTDLRSGRLYLLAVKTTDDATSAIAGFLSTLAVNATTKELVAPKGVTFSGGYTDDVFGDEEDPATGTFHNLGVNAVFRDFDGTFRISNDRANTTLTDFERFHSTRRSIRFIQNELRDDILGARRVSGTAIPFTDSGITAIRNIIEGRLGRLRDAGIIDSDFSVVVPKLADVSSTDRQNRVLPGISVSVRLAGQIHKVEFDLNVAL